MRVLLEGVGGGAHVRRRGVGEAVGVGVDRTGQDAQPRPLRPAHQLGELRGDVPADGRVPTSVVLNELTDDAVVGKEGAPSLGLKGRDVLLDALHEVGREPEDDLAGIPGRGAGRRAACPEPASQEAGDVRHDIPFWLVVPAQADRRTSWPHIRRWV